MNSMNMHFKYKGKLLSCLFILTLSLSTNTTQAVETLVFSAPPRESKSLAMKIYEPIARFLSRVTGKKVVYKHPDNWMTYTNNMRHNKYDIVFDGPSFVSWRIKHLNHRPAVKIPGNFAYAFITSKKNNRIRKLNDLVAKKVCGPPPPSEGSLHLHKVLDNPIRQPRLIAVEGWRKIYTSMLEGRCEAAVITMKAYKSLDPNRINTRLLYKSKPEAGQAITVSPVFNKKDFNKIRSALLDKNGQLALSNLKSQYASPPLIPARPSDYRSDHSLLESSYGFASY